MTWRVLAMLAAAGLLGWSFWFSSGWLQLCAGLALFLFGMQCLEEGLRQLAGGRLEQVLARSTGTRLRALLFGIGATVLLQSSTLVSLLTIAFLGSGLIQFAGGIAIILGANLGATSGIWLLALLGHGISLTPLALPLLVFAVLAGFIGERGRAAGRVLIGVVFIFFAIDMLKLGFAGLGGDMDLTAVQPGGVGGVLLFAGIGLLATVILQSSHATLMLVLTALALGQLGLDQALALAIGSNLGSSVSTAVVGILGGQRSGQRLAIVHVLFNGVTAVLALALLPLWTRLVSAIAGLAGFGGNDLLQLALFHTLFNGFGVLLFWPWQERLATLLKRWLPDPVLPAVLTAGPPTPVVEQSDDATATMPPPVRARHLHGHALESVDAAAAAVALELRHLGQLGMEVICQALCLPVAALLDDDSPEDRSLDRQWQHRLDADCGDADALYQHYVKGVYGDLLGFMGGLELPMDQAHQRYWQREQMAALQLVNAVKDARHLQKNLRRYLSGPETPMRQAYVRLRWHLLAMLRELYRINQVRDADDDRLQAQLAQLQQRIQVFESEFRHRLFGMVREGGLDGWQAGSLMNDLGYVTSIQRSLVEVMANADEPDSLRELRRLAREPADDEPMADKIDDSGGDEAQDKLDAAAGANGKAPPGLG
ncbi:MAG: Na/Pi symporter [Xanthomonadales bacterium]|nr:Na/Pi symporter [Xanthomonadales bacterium]